MTLLNVNQLYFAYGDRTIFDQVSFDLEPGQIMTILGPNGVGKSTLLSCLTNQLKEANGQININDRPLDSWTPKDLAQHMALVPQDYRSGAHLTVIDYLTTARAPYLGLGQVPNGKDEQLAIDVLEDLGIKQLLHRRLPTLSGGQMQLVAIARALVQEPELLILDEPMAALDLGRQRQVLKIVQQLAKRGVAIILTTHIPNQALLLNDQVGLLFPGGEFLAGHCQEIISSDRLEKLYHCPVKVVYVPELGRSICEMC